MTSARECIDTIKAAGKGLLDDDQVLELVERVQARLDRARAERQAARADVTLREGLRQDAEALRLEAALARKHAALTVLARQRVLGQVALMRQQGLDPRRAFLAVLEGSARGIQGARASVAAAQGGYRASYLGQMFTALDELGPGVIAALRDGEAFQDQVVREMRALGKGGQVKGAPVSGNALAQQVAQVFARVADLSRRDLNRLGGMVGDLEGWTPQAHDRDRIARAGRDAWIETILPRLDLERSFPDAAGDEKAVRGILAELFDSITSNVDRVAPERDQALAASRVTPTPNLARTLSRHRTLHFRDADAWLDYRRQFGTGHIFDAMIGHLERAARIAGQMEVLGPNPAFTLQTALDAVRLDIRNDPAIPPEAKEALAAPLTLQGSGGIASAYAEVQGLTFGIGGSKTAAHIMSEMRAWQGAAKLAGAFITSVFSDPWIQAAHQKFLGRGWGNAIAGQVSEMLAGVASADRRRMGWQLGQGFDTLAQTITSSYFVHDGQPGVMQRLLTWTMRYQGLAWITDNMRSAGARMMAEQLGQAAGVPWSRIDAPLRHALGLHNIGEAEWAAISQAKARHAGGKAFITPDAVRDLPDQAIVPLLGERLSRAEEAARKRGGDQEAAEMRARLIGDERRRLEIALHRYINDELRSFAVLEPGAQVRRVTLNGTQRGTYAGEALRMLATFKSFPVGFTLGPLARQWHGGPAQRSAGIGNIAMLIGGLAVLGYAAMTAKDFVRGYEPRDPTNLKTILAALLQSGGLGIYGDFLFGEANRFGGSTLATVAGPVIGEAASLVDLAQRARSGEASAAEALNWLLRNTPFINLWYVRPALDYAILNEMRDAVSPGFIQRQQLQRYRDYGQDPLPWGGQQLDVF
jgi:hypothetical protein